MDAAISAEKLSALIGLIYDCAIDPDRWSVAMEAIRAELNFANAALDLMELPTGRLISNVVCNIPARYMAMLPAMGPDVIDQWGGEEAVRRLPFGEPAVLSWANPAFDPETTTNPYYLNFGKPQGLIDVMAIGLARDARGMGTLAFGRHASAGLITAHEIAVAQLLVPHLQRAATLNRLIDGLAMAQAAFSATLDAVTVPVFLLGPRGHVLHANPAARLALEARHLVRQEGGLLQPATHAATTALAAAVRAAAQKVAVARPGLGIPVLAADGGAGALHVMPLPRPEGGAVAAVFLARVDAPFAAPTEIAAALFQFTPTEARVFQLIVTGHTQAEAATALGIERSTVKSHLLRLYDKVGVRRQADLVQVAASLAIPVA